MDKLTKPYYQAYLMRFWKERESDKHYPEAWRFTLEDPHSGERQGFSSLESFIKFLERQMEDKPESL